MSKRQLITVLHIWIVKLILLLFEFGLQLYYLMTGMHKQPHSQAAPNFLFQSDYGGGGGGEGEGRRKRGRN